MLSDGLKKALDQLRQTLAAPDESAQTDGQLLASFVKHREQAAFAALLRRHGPMVLAVCRRVLGRVHDAEDAFQATFLVLARKAASLRDGEAMSSWLYGVAHRTALQARAQNARRRLREQPLANVPSPEAPPEEPRDWLPLLHRAIRDLPPRYRLPIVLCHLEERSRQEAAQQLGVPEGTLSSRLATARRMLAKKLARHRLTLSMGVMLAALSEETAAASIPASLFVSTTEDALRIAAGQTVTTPAAALMKKVLQMMFLTKLKLVSVGLTIVGVMGVLTASFFAPMRAADEKLAEANRVTEPAAKNKLARKITLHEIDIGDMASLLHIQKQACEVELGSLKPHTPFGAAIEVYKDGRKVKTYEGGVVSVDKPIRANIVLLAADLDYLPLRGAREKHCRMKIECAISSGGGRASSSSEIDIPKELFDFSRSLGSGWFAAEAGFESETPLFYFHVSRSGGGMIGASTQPELLEKNPKGDFLIAYLRDKKNYRPAKAAAPAKATAPALPPPPPPR